MAAPPKTREALIKENPEVQKALTGLRELDKMNRLSQVSASHEFEKLISNATPDAAVVFSRALNLYIETDPLIVQSIVILTKHAISGKDYGLVGLASPHLQIIGIALENYHTDKKGLSSDILLNELADIIVEASGLWHVDMSSEKREHLRKYIPNPDLLQKLETERRNLQSEAIQSADRKRVQAFAEAQKRAMTERIEETARKLEEARAETETDESGFKKKYWNEKVVEVQNPRKHTVRYGFEIQTETKDLEVLGKILKDSIAEAEDLEKAHAKEMGRGPVGSYEIIKNLRPWGDKWSVVCESAFEISYKHQKERAEAIGDQMIFLKKTIEKKLAAAGIKTLAVEIKELTEKNSQ